MWACTMDLRRLLPLQFSCTPRVGQQGLGCIFIHPKASWKRGCAEKGGGSVKCLLLGFFLYRGRREDLPQSCCAAQSACKYTQSLLAGNCPRRSKYCYVVSSLSRHLCSQISGQEQNLECPSTAVKPAVMTFPTQPEVQEISQESLFLQAPRRLAYVRYAYPDQTQPS